jgi:exodeoxyribonuclease V gamma subunit
MGLVVLHGNRLETLRDITVAWLAKHPLSPFEDEVVLVQSNGIAQWFKMALARPRDAGGLGIAAGMAVELPSRFLWRTYRRVLGVQAVLEESPYAKHRLTWRLMRLLPCLLDDPVIAPVARYLAQDADGRKLHALAARVADLYDQYQVYRADWLDAWEAGRDELPDGLRGDAPPVPDNARWQPHLWRALQADMATGGEGWERVHRGAVHKAFLTAVKAHQGQPPAGFPPRIVVFGLSSLPQHTLEALAAMANWSEVILAVMNPSQHYWAEIIEDRELLGSARRRQQTKPGMPAVPAYEALHQYANPLLAAWGKQGRDFIRLLDEIDDPSEYAGRMTEAGSRIDAFEAPDATTVLGRVQASILDLEPRPEVPLALPPGDQSLRFSICHSAQREVEVLHDTLLEIFDTAHAEGRPLKPSDVIVMVPDIEMYAPIVEAVFGEIPPKDPRYLPIAIADRTARREDPVVRAVEFVLRLPEAKLLLSEVLDFLDLPVVARKLGLKLSQGPVLRAWIEGAGVRWGLDVSHREQLGLGAAGEQNTWWFGLRRMLLGYLTGDAAATDAIEPYPEIGGLEAEAVGALYTLLERLRHHGAELRTPVPPQAWGSRFRAVLEDFLDPKDDAELVIVGRLTKSLADWLGACEDASLTDAIHVAVVREAVLAGIDEVRLSQRFLGGGVMFATLMPMRAIPFEVVVLLGMNEGDYPRSRTPTDFDLMALPGRHRPGDRSRRDDDRYLFLEALLSARRQLLISWCGRNVRDNTSRPPSVLVGQLRDYLNAVFDGRGSASASDLLTAQHPLQPFSRRYAEGEHSTFWHEWLKLHGGPHRFSQLPPLPSSEHLTDSDLGELLRHPVRTFFRRRLGVSLEQQEAASHDHEAFAMDGLGLYSATQAVIQDVLAQGPTDAQAKIDAAVDRVRRAGALPLRLAAHEPLQAIRSAAVEVIEQWTRIDAEAPIETPQPKIAAVIDGTVVELLSPRFRRHADGRRLRMSWSPNSLLVVKQGGAEIKLHRLVGDWPAHLLAQLGGEPVTTLIVAPGGLVQLRPVDPELAQVALQALVRAWQANINTPLPIAPKCALAYVRGEGKEVGRGLVAAKNEFATNSFTGRHGEGDDVYVARAFPTFNALFDAGFVQWTSLYRDVARIAERV